MLFSTHWINFWSSEWCNMLFYSLLQKFNFQHSFPKPRIWKFNFKVCKNCEIFVFAFTPFISLSSISYPSSLLNSQSVVDAILSIWNNMIKEKNILLFNRFSKIFHFQTNLFHKEIRKFINVLCTTLVCLFYSKQSIKCMFS